MAGIHDTAFVFLHASNRTTEAAWPLAAQLPGARFAVMPGYESPVPEPFDQDRWESRLLDACGAGSVVLAHSFGGPVAMRAVTRHRDLVRALVLFEPAAYALARGTAAVEDHIARVQPVLDRAPILGAGAFGTEFSAAIGGGTVQPPETADALLAAERQRMLPGPWTLDTPTTIDVPTLVVTGGWNAEYETIAARLTGGTHVTLSGHGHRPQEHSDAAQVVLDFAAATTW